MSTNDNQTALMMSIQRKKDEVKRINHKIYLAKWDNSFHPTKEEYAKLSVLPGEITEDEKLLAVEKDRNDLATEVLNALDEACNGMEWRVESEPESLDESDYEALGKWRDILKRYNEKYGTDGK